MSESAAICCLPQVLRRSLGFLGLRKPTSDAEWAPLLDPPVQLAGSRPNGGAPLQSAATTALLREFYSPGLRELVWSLRDEPDALAWREWAQLAP